MHTCPGGDQQFVKAEMNTMIGFYCTPIDIDPAYSRSRVHVDVAVSVERLVVDQNFSLVGTLEKKFL
jgi:hypothetical protein